MVYQHDPNRAAESGVSTPPLSWPYNIPQAEWGEAEIAYIVAEQARALSDLAS